MPIHKEQLAFRAKGPLNEREDWWWLCYDTEKGEFHVEHEWDHMDPYRLGEAASDKGTSQLSLDQWRANGSPGHSEYEAARAKLLEGNG